MIDELMAESLEKLKFDQEIIDISYQAAKEKQSKNKNSVEQLQSNIAKQLKINGERLNKLVDMRIDEKIPGPLYNVKLAQLEKEKIELGKQLQQIEQKRSATFEPAKKIFLRGSKAKKEFLKAKDDARRHLLEMLFSNLSLEDGKVAKISFKMPYQLLANAPKNGDFNQLLGKRDSNPRVMGPEPIALPLGYSPV